MLEASDRESSNVLRIRGGGIFLVHFNGRGIVGQLCLSQAYLVYVWMNASKMVSYFHRADPCWGRLKFSTYLGTLPYPGSYTILYRADAV